jgi:hypothetical protein
MPDTIVHQMVYAVAGKRSEGADRAAPSLWARSPQLIAARNHGLERGEIAAVRGTLC